MNYYTYFLLILSLWVLPMSHLKAQPKQRLKVGLVFGGGGAKGAAEVGVLKYIEKSGIPIDYVAGTSIGSIVGGLYCCGIRSATLDSLFSTREWQSLLTDRNSQYKHKFLKRENGTTYLFGIPIRHSKVLRGTSRTGILRGDSISSMLNRLTARPDSIDFDHLPIPFACVAVDVKQLKEVVLKRGILSQAMRASMAIPALFKPVHMDNMVLVDGGVLNNLPVDVVKQMGADVVIAIDLTQHKRKDKSDKDNIELRGILGLIGWLKHRPDRTKYNRNRKLCDVYINPLLTGFDALDFQAENIKKMIIQGEKAGKKAEHNLLKLKRRIYQHPRIKKSSYNIDCKLSQQLTQP